MRILDTEELRGNYSPNTRFAIELQYGPYMKWKVYRRVLDFVRLHSILTFKHINRTISVKLPRFPGQLSYIVDMSLFRGLSKEQRADIRLRMSLERRRALEKYLCELLFIINMETSVMEVYEFLECSALSFANPEHGAKSKEGYLRMRLFDVQKHTCCWIVPKPQRFKTQWFIIRSSYIMYVKAIDQQAPSDVVLLDTSFKVEYPDKKSSTMVIKNGCKKLEVKCEDNIQMEYWIKDLRALTEKSEWCREHRHGSFAPVRSGSLVKWLPDCKDYFELLAKTLSEAQSEIYIHGWWVSPELYLVRPPSKNQEYRLDRLLQKKAMEGVKIYVIIFKEVTLALPINSYHTKMSLEKLHPNISVQRHPDHLGGILLWAHHDKLVVVDQKIAFVGGIDVSYGRYDSSDHRLVDYIADDIDATIWSGIDYSNPRIKDFRNVTQFNVPLIDRRSIPRMPWHDVQCALFGQAARDTARHFIERWNFIKVQKSMHREEQIPYLLPKPEFSAGEIARMGWVGSDKVQLIRSSSEWSHGTPLETSIYDAYIAAIEDSEHFIYIENQFFVSKCADEQVTPVRNRIASAICNRIIRAHTSGATFRVIVVLPLLPAFEAAVNRSEASCIRVIMQGQYSAICRGPHSIIGTLTELGIKPEEYISFMSLRTHDRLEGRCVTEQVYVHSKLMIVDDRLAIVGSANINDRSLLGVRDSELAVIVEADEMIDGVLNDIACKISPSVRALRIQLFREHLGLLDAADDDALVRQVEDPVKASFYFELWRHTASLNTQIYRELFYCVPDDCAASWDEYRSFTEKPSVQSVDPDMGIDMMENLGQIRGNLVMFPLNFLRKEDLAASMLTPEFLLPAETYL